MEGICFEVKPRDHHVRPQPYKKPLPGTGGDKKREEEQDEEEIQYRLTLVGSLAVHPQTTMAMLPWVVAEIRRPRLKERSFSTSPSAARTLEIRDQSVVLQISASSVRCFLDMAGPGRLWDPLQHPVLFEHRPHRVTKLIHNSQDPSYFGCLLREDRRAACYVFRCLDQHKVLTEKGINRGLERKKCRVGVVVMGTRHPECPSWKDVTPDMVLNMRPDTRDIVLQEPERTPLVPVPATGSCPRHGILSPPLDPVPAAGSCPRRWFLSPPRVPVPATGSFPSHGILSPPRVPVPATGSCPRHWFLSPPLVPVPATGSCPRHWILSRPLVPVPATGSCPRHWFLSQPRDPVPATGSCPRHWFLSPPLVPVPATGSCPCHRILSLPWDPVPATGSGPRHWFLSHATGSCPTPLVPVPRHWFLSHATGSCPTPLGSCPCHGILSLPRDLVPATGSCPTPLVPVPATGFLSPPRDPVPATGSGPHHWFLSPPLFNKSRAGMQGPSAHASTGPGLFPSDHLDDPEEAWEKVMWSTTSFPDLQGGLGLGTAYLAARQQFSHIHVSIFSFQVPEIISTLRQASKSSARQEDTPTAKANDTLQDGSRYDSPCSVPCGADAATAFAKKFEVLFCGRVVVAQRNAPPALIDECIEKFGKANVAGSLAAGIRRAFSLTQVMNGGSEGGDSGGKKPLFFRRDPSFPSLQALDENGLSPELQRRSANGAAGVQPTSLQENRTMLFTIGQSQIFLVSPDSKKVAIEKSFREISFCSQGIRHVDHFGFICRESVDSGSCQFVCYVFQCTNEALVDEIMLTLKQAFSVAALQKSSRTQSLQCDTCPMQRLHRLCDRIEGLPASKAKLELQKHVAGLDNQEQASVFETTLVESTIAILVGKLKLGLCCDEAHLMNGTAELLQFSQSTVFLSSCLSVFTLSLNALLEPTPPDEPQCALTDQLSRSALLGRPSEQLKAKARPKSDQEENELIVSCLRRLYEERQKTHTHVHNGQAKQESLTVCEEASAGTEGSMSSSRLRLEQFKSRAKRSLTESLEGIWKGSSRSKPQRENSEGDITSSNSTINSCHQDVLLIEPPSPPLHVSSPLRSHNSTGDLKRLEASESGQDLQAQGFRRRASTISHSPSLSVTSLTVPSERLTAATKPKLVRHYSVSTDSPHQSNPSGLSGLRARLHSSSSVPNFLKFLAPVEELDDSSLSLRKSDVAALSSPGAMCVVGESSPLRNRRHSWRQQIFLRVATPQKGSDTAGFLAVFHLNLD
ncbi:hypothetical protein NFI96_010898 [Prochilodus magdalenae]|nr:hypothetical protein NFI96_010898 [Prochilodus magdalenae]